MISHSTPLFLSTMGLYAVSEAGGGRVGLKELVGKRVGIVRGYDYNIEFTSNAAVLKEESLSDLASLRKLLKGRVDYAMVERRVFAYLVASNADEFSGRFKDVAKAIRPGTLRVSFSSKWPEAERMARLLDQGLAAIEASGEYDRINDRWSFRPH